MSRVASADAGPAHASTATRPPRAWRLPPAGRRIPLAELAGTLRPAHAPEALRAALAARFPGRRIGLHASGREALRATLAGLARRRGRPEGVLPAYTCFSVAAAAVAAGLRVRLVDVTEEGRVDPAALAGLPLERAAALVVSNLFGFAEPLAPIRALTVPAGVEIVDDAAQALGAGDAEGPAGGRSGCGVLSFGRGKPLSGLGGGAVVSRPEAAPEEAPSPSARPLRALAQGLVYDLALSPRVFGWLAAVPALGIGDTPFDPGFARGGLDPARAAVAAAALARLEADAAARLREARRLSEALRRETCLVPLEAPAGSVAVAPRLAVLAPDAGSREAALRALAAVGAGASPLYPCSLDALPALAPHLTDADADADADAHAGAGALPGAHALAARLVTLPTHGGLSGPHLERAIRALADAGCSG